MERPERRALEQGLRMIGVLVVEQPPELGDRHTRAAWRISFRETGDQARQPVRRVGKTCYEMLAGNMRPIRMTLPAPRAHATAGMTAQLAAGDADARRLLRRPWSRTVTAPAGFRPQIARFAAPRTVLLPGSLVDLALAVPTHHGIRESDFVTALAAPLGTQDAATGLDVQHPAAAAVGTGLLGGRLLGSSGAPAAQVAADDAHRTTTSDTVTLAFPHVLRPLPGQCVTSAAASGRGR